MATTTWSREAAPQSASEWEYLSNLTDSKEAALTMGFHYQPVELWRSAWTVTHQERGTIPFLPYKWWLTHREKVRREQAPHIPRDGGPFPFQTGIIKSRNLGSSTNACAEFTHKSLWYGGNVLIAADKQEHSQNLLDFCRQFIYDTKAMMPWMVPPIIKDNATEIVFAHPVTGLPYKRFKALASGESVGRSFRGRYLICSEMAYWKWPERTWAAVNGALSPNGEIIIESTPRGPGNLYARLITKMKRGENTMTYGSYDWTHNPEHTPEWYESRLEKLGPRAMAEEHECSLIRSGMPIFGAGYDLSLPENIEILHKWGLAGSSMGGVEIYHLPRLDPDNASSRVIAVGIDTAQGKEGGDYSSMQMIARDGNHVGEVWGQWPEDVFAEHCDSTLAFLRGLGYEIIGGVETNGCGRATWLRFQQLGTPGIQEFSTTPANKRPDVREFERQVRLGFEGKRGGIVINGAGLLDELTYYEDKGGGKSDAMSGYHDDRVDAARIACYYRHLMPGGYA